MPLTRRTAAPRPGPGDGVRPDRGVVLGEDAVPRREIGRAEQAEQDGARDPCRAPGAGPSGTSETPGTGATREWVGAAATRWWTMASLVSADAGIRASSTAPAAGRPASSRPPVTMAMSPSAVIRPMIATGRPQRTQTSRTASHWSGSDGGAHPLLGLADHDLERLHPGLAARDRIEVHEDAGPGPVGRLGRRARDAAGAEVLEAFDEARAR